LLLTALRLAFLLAPADLYNRYSNRCHQRNGRGASDAPAVAAVAVW
jgi:hypothetical protein